MAETAKERGDASRETEGVEESRARAWEKGAVWWVRKGSSRTEVQ